MKLKKLPIGKSDFKSLIETNCYFVDKSLFIRDVEDGGDILLYPRPRRFGKTLNLSMLKYFYDNSQDNSHLFKGLKIEQDQEVMDKQGKFPVIFLSFKDVKENSFELCIEAIKELLSSLYEEHSYLLDSDLLNAKQKKVYQAILDQTATITDYEYALKNLCELLRKIHNAKTIILIDEYDLPIQNAYTCGYYDDFIPFIRNFLSAALKDNSHLEKAVMTGILRVSKESIFSGLNNLDVNSIIYDRGADKFGITDTELQELLAHYGLESVYKDVKEWYDGYNFGTTEIYNPWSVINYIDKKKFIPYWVNTSGNQLISSILKKADSQVKQDFELLLEGKSIRKMINDNIVFADIDYDDNAIWNFLLMSGYLRYDNLELVDIHWYADLSIPNKEVKSMYYAEIVNRWFTTQSSSVKLGNLLDSLIKGDLNVFRYKFIEFCQNSFSYFDVSGNEPEKFYHAFVLGIIISLHDKYQIKSNRESGYGRYDIMLIPHNRAERAIIFEFKKVNLLAKEGFNSAMIDAKKQIKDKNYAQELHSLGIVNIANIAAVFEKKEVMVEVF